MKLVKSLLLGSAAGIVAVGSAVAADLPVRKAAPVDYVQVCSAFGTGYFYIPGTDTCLKVGGLVRWEYRYNESKWQAEDGTVNFDPVTGDLTAAVVPAHDLERGRSLSQFARAELDFNAMTATEFGTLASYIRIRGDQGGSMNVVHSYIEFAGITAGRAPSFFGYGGTAAFNGGFGRVGANEGNLIGYKADLGAVTVGLSLEDRASNQIWAVTGTNPVAFANTRANTNMPAVVGALEFSQGMFGGKLSGAVHQLRSNSLVDDSFADSKLGFAIQGGINVRVAPTTQLRFVATYADGALGYLSSAPINNRFNVATGDAFIDENNKIKTSQGWALAANVSHQWTPTVSQNVYGAFARITPPGFVRLSAADADSLGVGAFTVGGAPSRYDQWQVGTNVAWTPVSGLTVAGDVNYTRLETQHRMAINAPNGVQADDARFSKHDDRWTATLRIQRAF